MARLHEYQSKAILAANGIESFYLELDVPGLDELVGGKSRCEPPAR